RDVGTLLDLAAQGDDDQRAFASQAMVKFLRPLLESAGDWPIDARVENGQAWPPALVQDITERAARQDLATLAREAGLCRERTEGLRSTLRRIAGARDRLSRWLYSE